MSDERPSLRDQIRVEFNAAAGHGFCTSHDPQRTEPVFIVAVSRSHPDTVRLCLPCFAEAVFRVVSADAVVINRDDIPELLIEDLESAGDCDAGSCNFCLNAMLTAARLLSGGSPVAPENGGD